MSHREFTSFNKADKNQEHRLTAEFVEKYFGTLSILSTDSMVQEGGISDRDIEQLNGPMLENARESYIKAYEEPAADTGAVPALSAWARRQSISIRSMLNDLN